MKKIIIIFLIINLLLFGLLNNIVYAAEAQTYLSPSEQLKDLAYKSRQQRAVKGALGLICGTALVSWGFGNLNGMSGKLFYSFGEVLLDTFGSTFVAALGAVMGYGGIEAIFMPLQSEKDYCEMLKLDDSGRETYATGVLIRYDENKDKKKEYLSESKEITKPFNYDELRFENQKAIDRKTQEYLKKKLLPMFDDKRPSRDSNW